jgi:imidazole glycerol-phosphate synthase subunit HisH
VDILISIIDYGMGNLRSVEKALEYIGYSVSVTRDPSQIEKADGVILPGVGAFGAAMDNLKKFDLINTIKDVVKSGKPFLGICLGMQLLMEIGEEQGSYEGLGIISGKVVKFFPEGTKLELIEGLKVPQMGWNSIQIKKDSPLLKDIPQGSMVYFVHSFYAAPEEDVVSSTTKHGIDYCSTIWKDNVYAAQFHPEKSSSVGLTMLKNFAEVCKCK